MFYLDKPLETTEVFSLRTNTENHETNHVTLLVLFISIALSLGWIKQYE